MANITILQADNRPNLQYLLLTQEVNKKVCNHFGYKYLFVTIDDNKYTDIHHATKKIYVVNNFLNDSNNNNNDIFVFLDSDAWIQNCFWLNEIIEELHNNDSKHGCFSRDPYVKKNTFINSGSFILKKNEFTKQMYSEIINSLENDTSNSHYKNSWPYDQFYIGNYVFNHKEKFNIFIPDILNTPLGKVLRHNWHKTAKMYHDLYDLIANKLVDKDLDDTSRRNVENYYDKEPFPNSNENAYEYRA
jgi:hypothetical protein